MAKPSRATQKKRSREIAQRERREEKKDKKALKKAERDNATPGLENGIDPDLIGIFPGPQPRRED